MDRTTALLRKKTVSLSHHLLSHVRTGPLDGRVLGVVHGHLEVRDKAVEVHGEFNLSAALTVDVREVELVDLVAVMKRGVDVSVIVVLGGNPA